MQASRRTLLPSRRAYFSLGPNSRARTRSRSESLVSRKPGCGRVPPPPTVVSELTSSRSRRTESWSSAGFRVGWGGGRGGVPCNQIEGPPSRRGRRGVGRGFGPSSPASRPPSGGGRFPRRRRRGLGHGRRRGGRRRRRGGVTFRGGRRVGRGRRRCRQRAREVDRRRRGHRGLGSRRGLGRRRGIRGRRGR